MYFDHIHTPITLSYLSPSFSPPGGPLPHLIENMLFSFSLLERPAFSLLKAYSFPNKLYYHFPYKTKHPDICLS
jgi:hypothetical protein